MVVLENIDIDIDIDKKYLRNIDIDIDIDRAILKNIDIDIDIDKAIPKISISISISIRQFCKISISIKYRIDSNLAYRTGLWTMNIIYYKEILNPLSFLMTGATYWCKKQTVIVLV